MLRLSDIACIHIIGWNGHLREFVEEGVEQNLRRQHGEKDRSIMPSHTEHIAEVGTGTHEQVFDNVAKGFPSPSNPLVQDLQARFAEDNIRPRDLLP